MIPRCGGGVTGERAGVYIYVCRSARGNLEEHTGKVERMISTSEKNCLMGTCFIVKMLVLCSQEASHVAFHFIDCLLPS